MLYFTVLHYLYDKKLLISTVLVYVVFISLNAQMYENIRCASFSLDKFLDSVVHFRTFLPKLRTKRPRFANSILQIRQLN